MAKSEKTLDLLLKYGKRVNWSGIYLLLAFALTGAVLFFRGVILANTSPNSALNTMPEDVGYIMIGMFSFTLFFPFAYILCLLKICARQKEQIEELKEKIDSSPSLRSGSE